MFPQQPATHPETHPEPQPVAQPETQPETQPEPHQVPPYAPAATDPAGHELATWGSSVTAPADGPPPPPSPPPPAAPGRWAFRILVTVAVVLAAAIAVTTVLGWSNVSHLREGVSNREAEQATIAQQEQAAARKLLDDFRGAGLDSLLQRVKDLDEAADTAFSNWRNGLARFGVLNAAMDTCNDAVVAYNNAAGPFPDRLFTALPRQIDLKNPDTDCGRGFTASI